MMITKEIQYTENVPTFKTRQLTFPIYLIYDMTNKDNPNEQECCLYWRIDEFLNCTKIYINDCFDSKSITLEFEQIDGTKLIEMMNEYNETNECDFRSAICELENKMLNL